MNLVPLPIPRLTNTMATLKSHTIANVAVFPREKGENCHPSLRFSVSLCPGSGKALFKQTSNLQKSP